MKAAYITQPGPASSICFGEQPEPEIGEGDVLIRMEAAAVNHIDTYIRSGAYALPLPRPFIVGRDLVGVVERAGGSVTNFQPGDRVWSNCLGIDGLQGTFSEYVAAPAERLYHLPAGVGPEQAVAVLHSALTAAIGLFERAHLQPNETLFINGGSGSVGLAVLQAAKGQGARVAVTAGSPAKADRCRQAGADCVIDYHNEDLAAAVRAFAPEGVTLYWDATRLFDMELALQVLAPRGRMVVMAGLDRHCDLPLGKFYTRNACLIGFTVTGTTVDEYARISKRINGWLQNQTLSAFIEQVLPLSQTAKAHALQESGQLSGKLVVVPD